MFLLSAGSPPRCSPLRYFLEMTNYASSQLANLMAGGGMSQVRVPSKAELDEVRRVQGLQIRTAAADQATKLLAGKAPKMSEWQAVASAIEHYIVGTGAPDGHPTSVRAGA